MSKLDELKQEATELGVDFSDRIGEATLQARIDAFYESQETSGKEIEKAVEAKEVKAVEKAEEKSAVKGKSKTIYERAKEAEKAARKTKVITIIDNDQRENNQTTSVPVSCGNGFFDLGTIILPLNMRVEVMQGHINTLKEVEIPQHVKDPKTNLSSVVLRKRYTISYEEQ